MIRRESFDPRHRLRRAVAVLGVVGCLVLAVDGVAWAGYAATANGAMLVTSGSWGAIPTTTTSGVPPTGSLTLTFATSLLGNPASQYFSGYNSGTISLVASTYTVTLSGSALLGTTTVVLTACVGATWNTTAGTCSGTTTAIGSWTKSTSGTSVSSSAAPAMSASRLSVQASVTGDLVLSGSLTVVISMSVDSSSPRQIRAVITTNT
jgi:hypothetical protein